MKYLGLIIILLSAVLSMPAQEDQLKRSGSDYPESFTIVPLEIREICDLFFSDIINNKIEDAYGKLLKNSPIKKKKEDVENLVKQTQRAIRMYGDMSGFEPVSAEAATSSYIRVRYLSIHPDMPMRWIITFYKSPKRGWMVSNVRFDDLTEYFFSDE